MGAVRSAVADWGLVLDPALAWDLELPVVGETWDGLLNDEYGFHVKPEHAITAMKSATSGPVVEGSVGGGTGMIRHLGKVGTASRKVVIEDGEYGGSPHSVKYGSCRRLLNVNGINVGQAIVEQPVCFEGRKANIHSRGRCAGL
ncbi:P1 family peptidase [Candidatus Aalborgicola defluviihabitans]|uniref:P1 family peptidase n=1 Tax=Candidatus Aalborgicola defluviihabitans TaxID=3386187 RepID=UPI001DB9FABD|nr:P1 family peptidase [Burkholderiales bacterium]